MALIFNPGKDLSGNGNDWNDINISYTAGVTFDSMVDVPGIPSVTSQPDIGGVQRGNYCTMNPLDQTVSSYLTSANLGWASDTGADRNTKGTISTSAGKWYYEFTWTSTGASPQIGIVNDDWVAVTGNLGASISGAYQVTIYPQTGAVTQNGSSIATYGAFLINDVINVAYDLDAGKVWFGKNGTWFNSGNPATGINPATSTLTRSPLSTGWCPVATLRGGGYFNFGQRPFAYTPPTGFKSLNTTNLPNPVIKRPSDHFDTKLYTGNGHNLQVGTNPKQTAAFGTQSLRFVKNLNQYLTQTPKVTGNQQKFTISVWLKRTRTQSTDGQGYIWTAGQVSTNRLQLDFYQNAMEISQNSAGSWITSLQTAPVTTLNDYQNWHHHVLAVDSTQASQSNRVKYYLDGVLLKNDTVSATYMPLNQILPVNTAGTETRISYSVGGGGGIDCYMSEFYQIDGQQLAPTAFGAFDANNNWMPIKYTGTYGTNGSYVPMAQPTTPDNSTGMYANSFNGSSQYLSIPYNANLNLYNSNFTIEGWFNLNAIVAEQDLISKWYSLGNFQWILYVINGKVSFAYTSNGSSVTSIPISGVSLGTWFHVAVSGNSSAGTINCFFNGVLMSTLTGVTFFNATTTPLEIMVDYNNGTRIYSNGYASNVRIIKGTSLYSTNFTPSTALTAVTNTQLLTCNSATIVDNSTNAYAITNNGTATVVDNVIPLQRTVGYDASGTGNDWTPIGYDWSLPRPTVLTYGVPGTYTWTAPTGVTSVKALVIAGGGGGASNGGGGGAGGMIYNAAVAVTPGQSYTVTVGAGGSPIATGNAQNSVFSSLTAIAGGNGASHSVVGAAQAGGSGGGGSLNYNTGGAGTAGQGFAGGNGDNGNSGNTYYGSGGGGAGGTGFNSSDSRGGVGKLNTITGIPTYYAGGGAGHYYVSNGAYFSTGGLGGGGSSMAADHSGGGLGSGRPGSGGGGAASGSGGGNGGSGVVILSYNNAYNDGINTGIGTNTILNQSIINDGPTDSAAGGSFCEWDPTSSAAPLVPSISSNDNLLTLPRTDNKALRGTIGVNTGKWYWEILSTGFWHSYMGITQFQYEGDGDVVAFSTTAGRSLCGGSTSVGLYAKPYGTTSGLTALGAAGITNTGYFGFALDCDAGTIQYYFNNTLIYTAIDIPRNITVYPYIGHTNSGACWAASFANFGQRPFRYTPPTGYVAINTKNLKNVGGYNLPDANGNFVNTPDLVWTKCRTGGNVSPRLYDTTRGPGVSVGTNSTGASGPETNAGLSAFLPNGFELYSPNSAAPYGLENGYTYAAWCWNKGKTPGFDIVNFNSTGGVMQVPHNLGQVPKFMMLKGTNGVTSWVTYHVSLGPTQNLRMDATAVPSVVADWFGDKNPTTTHFTVGANFPASYSWISYLWAEVPGFSKMGSYTGNATSPGPFIYCGFRPAWVLIRGTATGRNWVLFDSKRTPYNSDNATSRLKPNDALVEDGNERIDFVSNGFKLNTYTFDANAAETYIYVAFAEAPFKYANAR